MGWKRLALARTTAALGLIAGTATASPQSYFCSQQSGWIGVSASPGSFTGTPAVQPAVMHVLGEPNGITNVSIYDVSSLVEYEDAYYPEDPGGKHVYAKWEFLGDEDTSGSNAVRFRSVHGIDRDAFGSTESITLEPKYRVAVDVDAPGRDWALKIHSRIEGKFLNLDDNGHESWSNLSIIPGSVISGHALYPGTTMTISPSKSFHGDGDEDIKDEANGVLLGSGVDTVIIEYDWESTAHSVADFFTGGDIALVRLGFHPVEGGSHFTDYYEDEYDDDVLNGEGHFVTAELVYLPQIVSQTQSLGTCAGSCASLCVDATGTDLQFDWYRGSTLLQSSDSKTYCASEAGTYYCRVYNDYGSVDSEDMLVQVHTPLSFDVTPTTTTTICPGEDVLLFGAASGSEPSYKWVLPSGAEVTGQVLDLQGVDASENGQGMLVVTSPSCPAITAPFEIEVLQAPVIEPIDLIGICGGLAAGAQATLSETGALPVSYSWWHDGVEVGTTSYLDLGTYGPEDEGEYTLTVTNANGCTDVEVFTVQPATITQDGTWLAEVDDLFLTPPTGSAMNWTSVCPPTGVALVADLWNTLPDASFEPGDDWALIELVVGGGSSTEQAAVLPATATLSATDQARAENLGVIRLLGGDLFADTNANSGGIVEGTGRIGGDVRVTGELYTPDRGLESSGPLTVNGTMDVSASGRLELVPATDAHLLVHGPMQNDGLVVLGEQSRLEPLSLSSTGGSGVAALGALTAGIEMHCATIDPQDAYTPIDNTGWLIGSGIIQHDIDNDGVVRALGDGIEVQGTLHNLSGGNVLIDGSEMAVVQFIGNTAGLYGNLCGDPGTPCSADFACGLQMPFGGVSEPKLYAFGDIVLDGASQVLFEGGSIETEGDFRSAITDPFAFDLSEAALKLSGYFFLGSQELELGTPDLGSQGDFGAPALHSIGELVIGPTPADVRLAGSLGDALYVERLVIANQAVLQLGSGTVYAKEVEIQGTGHLALEGGVLFAETVFPADACAQGLVSGDCFSQLQPLPPPDCDGNGVDDAVDIAAGLVADCNGNGVPDSCDLALGTSFDQDGNGQLDDCQELSVDRPWISVGQGGTQLLNLHAGADQANKLYVVAGSLTGTTGLPIGGVHVPLDFDAYTMTMLEGANSFPFIDTTGFLDTEGSAQAQIAFEKGVVPTGATGLVAHHAYVLIGPNGIEFASNPTALELRP